MSKVFDFGVALSKEEATAYTKILDSVSKLPKNDPRFALVVGITYWLLHRRRRLEQQKVRRRQFYRRWKRLLFLRYQILLDRTGNSDISTRRSSEVSGSISDDFDSVPDEYRTTKGKLNEDLNNYLNMEMENGDLTS